MSVAEQKGLFRSDEYYSAGTMTSRPSSVEPFSLHMSIVAVAILVGWASTGTSTTRSCCASRVSRWTA